MAAPALLQNPAYATVLYLVHVSQRGHARAESSVTRN